MALTMLGLADKIINEAILEINQVHEIVLGNSPPYDKKIGDLEKAIHEKLERAAKFVRVVDKDIEPYVTKNSMVKKRELVVWMFTGSVGRIEQDVSNFMKVNTIHADRIFKILQSECVLHKKCGVEIEEGKKSITITIFYYKE